MTAREYINMCKVIGLFDFNTKSESLFIKATKLYQYYFGLSEIEMLTYYAGYVVNSAMIVDDMEELLKLEELVAGNELRLKYEDSARNIIKGVIKHKGNRLEYHNTYEGKNERFNILDIVIKSIGSYDEHKRELIVFGQTYREVFGIAFDNSYDIRWYRYDGEYIHCGTNKNNTWEIVYAGMVGYYSLRKMQFISVMG